MKNTRRKFTPEVRLSIIQEAHGKKIFQKVLQY
jgi:transposase-like protein